MIEIVSPGDETWAKHGFYAAHRVQELLIVDPGAHSAARLGLRPGGEYAPIEGSALVVLSAAELAARLDWPD